MINKDKIIIQHSSPHIDKVDIEAVTKLLKSGLVAKGALGKTFQFMMEKEFPNSKAIVCSSGTAAIVYALKLLNLKNDDEIILPSYVCESVYNAVLFCGAKPVLCDITSNWVVDDSNICEKITKKTKAIIAVHTFGIYVDILNLKKFGVTVIEDCSQGIGINLAGDKYGVRGDMSIYSFSGIKYITSGEGGLLIVNEADAHSNLLSVGKQYERILCGISDIQSSLLISQFEQLDYFTNRRLEIAERYISELPSIYVTRIESLKAKSVFYRFPLEIESLNFERTKLFFEKEGISVRRGVDALIHRKIGERDCLYPNTVERFNCTLSIPLYPSLSDDDVEKIIYGVNTYERIR